MDVVDDSTHAQKEDRIETIYVSATEPRRNLRACMLACYFLMHHSFLPADLFLLGCMRFEMSRCCWDVINRSPARRMLLGNAVDVAGIQNDLA